MDANNKVQKDYNKIFAKRLRTLMEDEMKSPLKRKVTQQELADVIGKNGIPIKRQTISMYINGKSAPDMEKFKIIADYFNSSYDYLLGITDTPIRENIDISNELGLSDRAIIYLKLLKKWKEGTLTNDEVNKNKLTMNPEKERGELAYLFINKLLEGEQLHELVVETASKCTALLYLQYKLDAMQVVDEKRKEWGDDTESNFKIILGKFEDTIKDLYLKKKIEEALKKENLETHIIACKRELSYEKWEVREVVWDIFDKILTSIIIERPEIIISILNEIENYKEQDNGNK